MRIIASVFNPNFSYTYVAPERPLNEKLTFQWVNLSQLVISTHCISNARFSMDPVSRGFVDDGWGKKNVYGKTSASLQGRVTHLALLLLVGAMVFQTPAWIGMALISSLVATKVLSNLLFIRDELWTVGTFRFDHIYKGIPDPEIRGSKGEIGFIEAVESYMTKEDFEKILKYLKDTNQIDTRRDAEGYTVLLKVAENAPLRISSILSFHPNIHVTYNFNGTWMNALELAARKGAYETVAALVGYENNGDSFSKEEIQKALKQTEPANRSITPFMYERGGNSTDRYLEIIAILKEAINCPT